MIAPRLLVIAATLLSIGLPAQAADILGNWKLSGSVAFNALDTTCHFKQKDGGIWATCDDANGPGGWIEAKIADNIVAWKWKVGRETLGFQGILMSETRMKGRVAAGGVFGKFVATKQ